MKIKECICGNMGFNITDFSQDTLKIFCPMCERYIYATFDYQNEGVIFKEVK